MKTFNGLQHCACAWMGLMYLTLFGLSTPSTSAHNCTHEDQDPFATGVFEPCCWDLVVCRKEWEQQGSGITHNLCVQCCEEPCGKGADSVHVHEHFPSHQHFYCVPGTFNEPPGDGTVTDGGGDDGGGFEGGGDESSSADDDDDDDGGKGKGKAGKDGKHGGGSTSGYNSWNGGASARSAHKSKGKGKGDDDDGDDSGRRQRLLWQDGGATWKSVISKLSAAAPATKGTATTMEDQSWTASQLPATFERLRKNRDSSYRDSSYRDSSSSQTTSTSQDTTSRLPRLVSHSYVDTQEQDGQQTKRHRTLVINNSGEPCPPCGVDEQSPYYPPTGEYRGCCPGYSECAADWNGNGNPYGKCVLGDTCPDPTFSGNQPQPPTAMNDEVTTMEDTPVSINVIANDSDPDNDLNATSVVVERIAFRGVVTCVDGVCTYDPEVNYHGLDSFQYRVCDNTRLCSSAVVRVIVTPTNDGPICENDFVNTLANEEARINVLLNDRDPDNNVDRSATLVVAAPDNGSASCNNLGFCVYTPNADYVGDDAYSYQVCDSETECAICTVFVTVAPNPDGEFESINPPVANDDAVTTAEDTPIAINVVANDEDADDDLDITTVTVERFPDHGGVSCDTAGICTYEPNFNFNGPDSFQYRVCDAQPICDSANVTITVTAIGDAPILENDYASTLQNVAVRVHVMLNDRDPEEDLDPTTTAVFEVPMNGNAACDAEGYCTYTPAADFAGEDRFIYELCDRQPVCATAIVFVTVVADNTGGGGTSGGGNCDCDCDCNNGGGTGGTGGNGTDNGGGGGTTGDPDPDTCTVGGLDPWRTGVNQPCCSEFETCLNDWNRNDNYYFLCLDTCQLECTPEGQDPWQTYEEVECCDGLQACLGPWYDATVHSFLCLESCPREEFPIPPVDPLPDTPSASKRGFSYRAITGRMLYACWDMVTWAYTWESSPVTADIATWVDAGIEFVPMIWGSQSPVALTSVNIQQPNALMGYNEPNHPSQANMNPVEAAQLWPSVEQLAQQHSILELVSPSLTDAPGEWSNPVEWMREFNAQCNAIHGRPCRVDAISVHTFVCHLADLEAFIARFDEFDKPIWLTEFACVDDPNRTSAEGQAQYMLEVLPWLEENPKIRRYAWFSYNFTIRADGIYSEADLFRPDGEMSPLGNLYGKFVRSEEDLERYNLAVTASGASRSVLWMTTATTAVATLLLLFSTTTMGLW